MKSNRCLGCHDKLDNGYYFCSFTCAILCGYMGVKIDNKRNSILELKDKKTRDKFLNSPPLRVRENRL